MMSANLPSSAVALTGAIQPVRIGFIPLVDCAPLLLAVARGLFHRHGVRVELSCEVGWATMREKLLYGQLDAAHAIAGLALALRMGINGPVSRVAAPFVFNLNGNAITLSRDLWNRGARDADGLRKLIHGTSRRLTFGMVSRFSSHHFLLRNWLRSGGINPDHDVRLAVLPPTQMAANLRAGLVDGYCVGEPWNSEAVEQEFGWVVATSEQLAPGHPEKALVFSERFVEAHPEQSAAIVESLRESCEFCDAQANRREVVRTLHRSGCFSCSEAVLSRSLVGPFDTGSGSQLDAARFHVFHRGEANVPTAKRGAWIVNEFIAHGLVPSRKRAQAVAAMRECWNPNAIQQASQSVTKKPKFKPHTNRTSALVA